MSNIIPDGSYIPNIYYDNIMYLLTSEEWKVLLSICRHTQLESDCADENTTRITKRIMAKHTGMNPNTCKDALANLCRFRLLTMTAPNNAKNQGAKYQFNTSMDIIDTDSLISRRNEKISKNRQKYQVLHPKGN